MFSILLTEDNVAEYMSGEIPTPSGRILRRIKFQFETMVAYDKKPELRIFLPDKNEDLGVAMK